MNQAILERAKAKAKHFLENEGAFQLGALPTEQSHRATRELSSVLQTDVFEGLRMLFSVDAELPEKIAEVVQGEPYAALVRQFTRALKEGCQILFSGCGATGRLCLIIESAWRTFWAERPEAERRLYGDCVSGMITGGDRALVRSVEGFEDYASFGRKQLQAFGIGTGDVLVAVSEGGETSSVIGSAWQALEDGASVFFAFNNPATILREQVCRSRELIDAPGVTVLDLCTGPMAIAGSTRLQAVTVELIVLGSALETAMSRLPELMGHVSIAPSPADLLRCQIAALSEPENLSVLADLVSREAACYRAGGRVTYVADRLMLDLMQDTTERTPTFSLPPFRVKGDSISPPSWAFIKHPALPTEAAWLNMLGHEPRGLGWSAETYAGLGAPPSMLSTLPNLSGHALYAFEVGCEHDASRYEAPHSLAMCIESGEADLFVPPAFEAYLARFTEQLHLSIRAEGAPNVEAGRSRMVCPMPATPLCLWERVAVKLIFNTLSTATMVSMGYVDGNWMSRVEASNKKLIDRGVRLVAELGKMPYAEACVEFHITLELLRTGSAHTGQVVAPAVVTLERLQAT